MSAVFYLSDVQGPGGCAHLWRQGGLRPRGPRSAQEAPSPRPPGKGLMGAASEECQERGETGAGAAAAVATGKGCGEGGRGQGGMISYKEVWWLENTGKRKKNYRNPVRERTKGQRKQMRDTGEWKEVKFN